MNETTRATRNMYEVMLRQLIVLVVALAVLGSVVGYLVADLPGVWGALMGAAIAALFTLGTVITMMRTADKPVHVMSAAMVGGWIVKMVLLFAVLIIVRGREFYSPGVFFVVMALAILGSLAIEFRAILTARIPTVEPTGSSGAAGPGEGSVDPDGEGRPA